MADTDQVLNLAAIIRKVDGNHSKGAAALAESILDHPNFRDVLARWGNPAPPPADGEVAELVEMLKGIAYWRLHGTDKPTPFDIRQAARLTRAAELLERLNPPQPVPVSERLPGPEDCDAEGRCWWGTPSFVVLTNCYSVTQSAQWRLSAPDDRFGSEVFWLPAHALPLPEAQP